MYLYAGLVYTSFKASFRVWSTICINACPSAVAGIGKIKVFGIAGKFMFISCIKVRRWAWGDDLFFR